jgi:hypothetical protein
MSRALGFRLVAPSVRLCKSHKFQRLARVGRRAGVLQHAPDDPQSCCCTVSRYRWQTSVSSDTPRFLSAARRRGLRSQGGPQGQPSARRDPLQRPAAHGQYDMRASRRGSAHARSVKRGFCFYWGRAPALFGRAAVRQFEAADISSRLRWTVTWRRRRLLTHVRGSEEFPRTCL